MYRGHMSRRALRRAAPLLLLGAAFTLPAAAATVPVNGPFAVHLTRGGVTVKASAAGFCRPEMRGDDGCVPGRIGGKVGLVPRFKCALPVDTRGPLKVDFGEPGERLYVTLIPRGGDEGPATFAKWSLTKQSVEGRRFWRVRLPGSARKAIGVFVSAGYDFGDVHQWAGLATASCRASQASP
jgi:hypothetical protein